MTRLKAYLAWFGGLAARAVGVGAAILILAAAVPLLSGGWDRARVGETAINLGFVVTGLGALLGLGRGLGLGTNPQYQAARTAGQASGEERARQDFAMSQPPAPLMLVIVLGGVLAMVAGFLL
jgi:hypothetical protein